MGSRSLRILVIEALLLLPLYLGGPARAAEVLTVGMYQEPPTMDPHTTFGELLLREVANVYEPLLRTTGKPGEWEPVLATKWTESPDGRVYTFTLRQNVKFSDGTPLTAEAVKTSFERIAALKRQAYIAVAPIEKMDVLDPSTIRITLKTRNNAFLYTLKLANITSPAAIKQYAVNNDRAQKWFDENSAGTGPYKIGQWVRGQVLRLVKNDSYWRGWKPGQFNQVDLRFNLEADTQRVMLERGELDWAQVISVDALSAIEKNPSLQVIRTPFAGQMYMMLNTAAPPLNDVRVRQALAHTWNHVAYNKVMQNLAPRSDGPIPLKLLPEGYKPKLMEHDLEKAKALLKEAGYPNGGFHLVFQSQKQDLQKRTIFEMMQAELQKLGISSEIPESTWTAIMGRAKDWGATRDPKTAYHAILFYKSGDVWHPWGYVYRMFHSAAEPSKPGGQWNFSYYENPKVDSLMDEALVTADSRRAGEMWRQVNEILIADAPALYIDKLTDIAVMKKNIKGYVFKDYYVGHEYHLYELSRAH